MSGGPDKLHKIDLTRAAFWCVALVLLVTALHGFFGAVAAQFTPVPSPVVPASAPATAPDTSVVLFGTTSDPLCEPVFDALGALCGEKGWALISYDCKGSEKSQKGQIEDFLRAEKADIAVLYSVMEQKEQSEQIKALGKVCKIITLGQESGGTVARYVSCHIGVDQDDKVGAAAEYFKANTKRSAGALLLLDVPDETLEKRLLKGFSEKKVTILDKNYSWTGAVYAARYLESALPDNPRTGMIFCTSSAGAEGALSALTESGQRGAVKILSLSFEQGMADAIALGDLDAALLVRGEDMASQLADALVKVQKGEKPENASLPVYTVTADNVDELT